MTSKISSRERLERFERFCGRLGLELEPFQKRICREVFAGRRELLILLPRGNGKTTLLAALALFLLITTEEPKIYLAASSRDQAALLYEAARTMILRHEALTKVLKPMTKRIKRLDRPGDIYVLSSDAPRAHGLQPTFAIVDEWHAHPNDQLYVALKTAMGKRMDAQMVEISTAGYDEQSALGKMRRAMLAAPSIKHEGHLTVAVEPQSKTAMLEWALLADEDPLNPEHLKRANPASFVSVDFLREQVNSPGLHPSEVARYHGNMWTAAAEQLFTGSLWDSLRGSNDETDVPDGSSVWVTVDAARKHDTACVLLLHTRDDGRVLPKARVWAVRRAVAGSTEPPAHDLLADDRIPLAMLEDEIRGLCERFDVRGVIYDPMFMERSAQTLSDEGVLMVEFKQTPSRQVPASLSLYQAINDGLIVHDGDPVLRAHVLAAAAKPAGDSWRISRLAANRPIDAAVCLMMGIEQALEPTVGVGMEWW